MEKITRIFEGYFNNVDNDSDEIIKDIEETNNEYSSLEMHIIIYQYNEAFLKWILKELNIDKDCQMIINSIKSLNCIDDYSFQIKIAPLIADLVQVLLNKKFQDKNTYLVNNVKDISRDLIDRIKELFYYCLDDKGNVTDEYMPTETRFAVDIIVKPVFDCTISYKLFSLDMHLMHNVLKKTVKDCEIQYGPKPDGIIIIKDTKSIRKQELWLTRDITPNDLLQAFEMITGKDARDTERSLHYEDADSLAKEHQWIGKI